MGIARASELTGDIGKVVIGDRYLVTGTIDRFCPEDETTGPSFIMNGGLNGDAFYSGGMIHLLKRLAGSKDECHIFGVMLPIVDTYRISPIIIQSHAKFTDRWEARSEDLHEKYRGFLEQYHQLLRQLEP